MAKTSDTEVSSTDFQNRPGAWMDMALRHPVFITKHNRPSRVLLDIEEYERLKRLDTRQAILSSNLPEDLIEAIRASEMDPRHDHLNAELD